MRQSSPRHKATPPRRMLALGGAVAVSALTIGGALGLVPGAALGNPPRHGAAPPADSDVSFPDAASPGTSSTDDDVSADAETPPPGAEADQQSGSTRHEEPALPARSGHGKRVVFDMAKQRVWLVGSHDQVRRTYPVSGSRYDNLHGGHYEVYSRSRHAVGFDGQETMDFMVRFAHGLRAPIGFHDIPVDAQGDPIQTRAELGTPLSAGCIRQWRSDARALWDFAPVGTRVVVVD